MVWHQGHSYHVLDALGGVNHHHEFRNIHLEKYVRDKLTLAPFGIRVLDIKLYVWSSGLAGMNNSPVRSLPR